MENLENLSEEQLQEILLKEEANLRELEENAKAAEERPVKIA